MVLHPEIRYVSWFSGAGALDLATRLALPKSRCLGYVEIEITACEILAERIREGSLDDAPIYTDIRSWPAELYCGCVDLAVFGAPCQPYSVAGKQLGESDERHLWRFIIDKMAICRPALVFIENVPPFVSGGAFRSVGEELCRLGYRVERPLFLAAEDVGASHRRERVFILAWRAGDNRAIHAGWRGNRNGAVNPRGIGRAMADAEHSWRRPHDDGRGCDCQGRHCGREASSGVGECEQILEYTEREPEHKGGAESRERTRANISGGCDLPLFAPGPADPRWPGIIERYPELAPAVKSAVRGLADEHSNRLDFSRSDQLRCLGNAVVPLAAALALRVLLEEAGIEL